MTEQEDQSGGTRFWMLAGALAFLCLVVRIRNLAPGFGGVGGNALPLFSDEAIYLRWAQLVRGGHWWVSLVDPKPPLHFWLLAGVYKLMGDPLLGARTISVLFGVATVPFLMKVCEELGKLTRWRDDTGLIPPPPSGRATGMLAAILMIFCPFVAFYQRLGTAESLFMLEMTAGVWVSLVWARRVAEGGRGAWGWAIGIGVVMGIGLMTRQGVSYTLCLFPGVAWMACAGARGKWGSVGRALLQGVAAGAIALLLWMPYLTAEMDKWRASYQEEAGPTVTVGSKDVIKRRILYQDQFTKEQGSRWELAKKNLLLTFVPSWSSIVKGEREVRYWSPPTIGQNRMPGGGWLWFYLTPPVYALCGIGFIWLMVVRREWWIGLLLVVWAVLMLGPLVGFLSVLRSRYEVTGVVPLLVAGAWVMGDWMNLLFAGRRQGLAWVGSIALLVGVVAWPLRDVGLQIGDWQRQVLIGHDRYEYLTGWTAGTATGEAVLTIRRLSRNGPVVAITGDEWGIPADAVWAYLEGTPGVKVYYQKGAMGRPGALEMVDGKMRLFGDKYLYTPAVEVSIPPEAQVIYICNDPLDGPAERRPIKVLGELNPNLRQAVTFYGIEKERGSDAVDIFLIQ